MILYLKMFLVTRTLIWQKINYLDLLVTEIWGGVDPPHLISISTPPCMSVAKNERELIFLSVVSP